ncbi:MAG: DegV family protein [Parasporobacterium sp.]|nr:DegV family protein [Parasporobacterium sp.]
MRNYAIIGDSTCDLNKNLREQLGVDYVQMNYVLDGKEYPASLDWEGLSAKEFYDQMRAGKRITTTQVPAESYLKKFQEYLDQDMDVLYISCSSALSGSVNTARVIARDLLEKNPEAKIICVDALNSSFGQGIEIMWASKMRSEGTPIEEVAEFLEKNRNCVNQSAFVEKLEYLRRAGRVTASSAFFGNLIGIKPLLISDAKGQNYAIKKVKGMQKTMEEAVALVKERIIEAEDQIIYISHADSKENAETIGEMVKEATGCKGIFIDYMGPIVGASVGPGTMSIYYVGQEETTVGEA